jgi:photosystem II stability/assembly factor-like uncharacterized protein
MFIDKRHGLAAGNDGRIVITSDGGENWGLVGKGEILASPLSSIAFSDLGRGWATVFVDTEAIIGTKDGGQNWNFQLNRQASHGNYGLRAVTFIDTRHGWAVGDRGVIVETINGGENWQPQTSNVTTGLNSVIFLNPEPGLNPEQGWAVGDSGTVIATINGGKTWIPQTSMVHASLKSVVFADRQRGWAVGDSGTIIATTDGGKNWTPQTSMVHASLKSVAFSNSQFGCAVGTDGTIVTTVNGGKTWDQPEYRAYPAPWFYLSLFIVFFCGVKGFRRPPPIPDTHSIADRLISDSPLKEGEFDALNLRDIAEGLSRFFRNVNTLPPMTVAIIGGWGFGKSSLMRLLEADLRKNYVRPVWFNAWHHQTEEHLLAYLLEAIHKQAIPFFLKPTGLFFRLRLLWRRIGTYWRPLLVSGTFIGFCGGVIYNYGFNISLSEDFIKTWAGPLAALGGIVAGFFGLKDALKPFGVSPAAILQNAAKGARIQALEAKTSFRMDFESQFRDVTGALDRHQMVIFIDDLDRCRPEQVLQVLEATNFLVSAGDCFVVLGIAREMVLAAVGLAFKEIANEVKLEPEDYADNYLRKLLNLEISIPKQDSEQVRKLVAQVGTHQPLTPAERLTAWCRRKAFLILFPFIIGGAMASFWLATHVVDFIDHASAKSAPILTPTSILIQPSATTATPMLSPTHTPTVTPTPSNVPPGVVVRPGAKPTVRDWWYAIFGFVALFLSFALLLVLFRRPDSVVDDSPNFKKALDIWSDVIAARYSTPREVKRFMNFVRYLAMRTRSRKQRLTPFERGINWIVDRIKGPWEKFKSWLGHIAASVGALLKPFINSEKAVFVHLFSWLRASLGFRQPGPPATSENARVIADGGNDTIANGSAVRIEIPAVQIEKPDEAAIVCMTLLAQASIKGSPQDYEGLITDANEAVPESLRKYLPIALQMHKDIFGLPSPDEWKWYEDVVGEVSVNGRTTA